MKYIKTFIVTLFILTLAGCSGEALVQKGVNLLDEMFTANLPGGSIPSENGTSTSSSPKSPTDNKIPEEPHSPEAVEPTIPDHSPSTSSPSTSEPSITEAPVFNPELSQTSSSDSITPSHTDATFFGPGESFKYIPKGVTGNYACTYTSEDEAIVTVDPNTGKVTAVGPGTTKVKMHVESNGQYDFECIVRCNWKEEDPEPTLPDESPQAAPSGITASHSDITFFNPKEHIKFLPVGANADITCSYTTDDAKVASVDEKGVITAVGPGTTMVTMTLDAGGTEYQFDCIVRCSWS